MYKIVPPPPLIGQDDIPIVQQLAKTYQAWHLGLQHLPRLSRYTLGVKIDTLFCEALELALEAGYASRERKLLVVQKASIKLDALKFFLKTAWELRIIDTKRFSTLAACLVEVGRMLGGWRKQLQSKAPPE